MRSTNSLADHPASLSTRRCSDTLGRRIANLAASSFTLCERSMSIPTHGHQMTRRLSSAQLAVVSVPVTDPGQAKDFYVNQLGFELVRDDDSMPGLHWVQTRPHGSAVSLTLVNWFESMPAGSLRGLVLTVDDLGTTYEELKAAGVEFESAPRERPWATEAVMRDPDGNQFVLQQG